MSERIFKLRFAGRGPHQINRLKRLLNVARRRFGFQCVGCEEQDVGSGSSREYNLSEIEAMGEAE